jgi:hypothetical protein
MRLAGQEQLKPGRRGYRESVGAYGSFCLESGRRPGTSFLRPRKPRPKSRRPAEPARSGSMRWTPGRRPEDCHQPPPRLGFARHRPSQRARMHREHSGIYRSCWALRGIVRRNERIARTQVSPRVHPCRDVSCAWTIAHRRAGIDLEIDQRIFRNDRRSGQPAGPGFRGDWRYVESTQGQCM